MKLNFNLKYWIYSFILHFFLSGAVFFNTQSISLSKQVKAMDLLELDTLIIGKQSVRVKEKGSSKTSESKTFEKKNSEQIASLQTISSPPPQANTSDSVSAVLEGTIQTITLLDYRKWVATHNLPPEYPRISRIRGDQGKVLIKAIVTPEGIAQVTLEASSGFEALDHSALETVKRWHFPKYKNQDQIVILIPYQFSFEE